LQEMKKRATSREQKRQNDLISWFYSYDNLLQK